jgi:hypothetical protein
VTTDHTARLYALAGTILGFFLAWAGIAAHPWARSAPQPQAGSSALVQYQQRLNRDAALVARVVASRKAASKPVVRVVTLPPVTTTRTS